MNTLTFKDTRLALDALAPWGLIVGGFTIAALALTSLPDSMRPSVVAQMTVADIFAVVAGVVGVTCGFVSAWLAAAIAQGDRRHGARILAQALPLAPTRVALTKGLVLLLVAAVPPLVAIACLAINRALEGENTVWGRDDLTTFALAVLGSAACGAGLGLGVATFVQGPFRAVAITLLAAIVAAKIGAIAQWSTFGWAAREDLAALEAAVLNPLPGNPNFEGQLIEVRWFAFGTAAIAGAAGAALCALAWGIAALASPRSTRWFWRCFVLTAVVAGVSGAAAGAIYAREHAVRWNSWAFVHEWAKQMDEQTIIEAIRVPDVTHVKTELQSSLVVEAIRRMKVATPAERELSPIAAALREKSRVTSSSNPPSSLWLVSFDMDEYLARALDYERLVPERSWEYRAVLVRLLNPPQDPETAETWPTERAAREARFAEVLLASLREHVANGHPQSERMLALIRVLEQEAAERAGEK